MLESVLSTEERLDRTLDQFPTRRDREYGFGAPRSAVKFSDLDSCKFLDILQYTNTAKVKSYRYEEGSLRDVGVASWFDRLGAQKPLEACDYDEQHEDRTPSQSFISGGIRLMQVGKLLVLIRSLTNAISYGVCNLAESTGSTILPLTESTFKTLQKTFCLPEQFIPIITCNEARAFTSSCPPTPKGNGFSPSTCFVFRFGIYKPNYYQLALSYSPTQKLTYGILFAKTKDHEFPYLISTLKAKESLCTHPLLLASLVIDLTIKSSSQRFKTADWRLNGLEDAMGQHEYVNRPVGDPLAIDFIAATRMLNATSRLLGVERMRLGSTLLALGLTAQETEKLDVNGEAGRIDLASRTISELAAYQVNACQNLVLKFEYAEKRVQSQIAVVYQFMAQKDSKVNISLAETSATIAVEPRKGSSSMKAIAVLTMCFLPGTFLAAIFAMPVFNWDADRNGSPLINVGFRYYWAIAIPLTVLVLGVWATSILLPWRVWLRRVRSGRKGEDMETGAVKGSKAL